MRNLNRVTHSTTLKGTGMGHSDWLFQNGANKNQHQESHQRETITDKIDFFFSKLEKAKKGQLGEQNTCMYVSEICAEGIFVTFPRT